MVKKQKKPTTGTDSTSANGSEAGRKGGNQPARRRTAAEAVEVVNRMLKQADESRLEIGRVVDEGVVANGGKTTYGEDTIGSLVEDHDLQCTAEHLRKCWHHYRLVRGHGEALGREFPELKFGHLYQLSRLYQLEDEHGAEEVAKAIGAMAHKAMADGRDGRPVPVDILARAVTTHLKSLKRHKLVRDGNGDGRRDETIGAEEEAQSIVLGAAVDGLNRGISDAMEFVSTVVADQEYRHAVALQTNVDRVAGMHIDLLRYILQRDPESIVIPMARKRVIALAELVGLTVVESGAAEKTEVAQ